MKTKEGGLVQPLKKINAMQKCTNQSVIIHSCFTLYPTYENEKQRPIQSMFERWVQKF